MTDCRYVQHNLCLYVPVPNSISFESYRSKSILVHELNHDVRFYCAIDLHHRGKGYNLLQIMPQPSKLQAVQFECQAK